MSPGIAATSPTSRTFNRSNALIPWNWLDGRSRTEMSRTADGPNRWPGLKLAAVSKGIPTIAASGTPESVVLGKRMNERRPVNRGFCVASGNEDPATVTPPSRHSLQLRNYQQASVHRNCSVEPDGVSISATLTLPAQPPVVVMPRKRIRETTATNGLRHVRD